LCNRKKDTKTNTQRQTDKLTECTVAARRCQAAGQVLWLQCNTSIRRACEWSGHRVSGRPTAQCQKYGEWDT